MNTYERRFYDDMHKLVKIQEQILKELQKMNEKERLVEVDEELISTGTFLETNLVSMEIDYE